MVLCAIQSPVRTTRLRSSFVIEKEWDDHRRLNDAAKPAVPAYVSNGRYR
jgi:hypothetical protein